MLRAYGRSGWFPPAPVEGTGHTSILAAHCRFSLTGDPPLAWTVDQDTIKHTLITQSHPTLINLHMFTNRAGCN